MVPPWLGLATARVMARSKNRGMRRSMGGFGYHFLLSSEFLLSAGGFGAVGS
jgi:hypothetical protein